MLPVIKDIEKKIAIIKAAQDEMNRITEKNQKIIDDNINEIIYKLRIQAAEMEVSGFKPSFIFDLPDHLRITIKTLMQLGEATAEDISTVTGRSRSLESSYLNSLTTMNYVEKKRKGQLVYYMIKFK
jgi:DNA-binding transcriptional ArsR family regulator